jgi:CheY-like chemotaxis protein
MDTKDINQIVGNYDIQLGGFDKLMPHRIKEVLLVAAPYDSFLLADDDRLTELMFSEYMDSSLRYAPRVTRVSTPVEALQRMAADRFDLIIIITQGGDSDLEGFVRAARTAAPAQPIVLLCYNMGDVMQLSDEDRAAVDGIFLWLGDPRIFMAIIKLFEDRQNLEHDINLAGVQTVILIEDSIRFYSSYLPIIYAELMKQTQLVMSEGMNMSQKLLRLRARPKILLASTFEEAWDLYTRYRGNILGIVTDIQFNRQGRLDPEAGLVFAEQVKAQDPDMPVLVQSSNAEMEPRAQAVGASFLNKASPTLHKHLQDFILQYFGFGDFVFRTQDGQEVGRASDLHSMLRLLSAIPEESVEFHASRNHFSKWLMARTEFEMAYQIRPRRISEFKTIDSLRQYIIETIHQFVHRTQLGTIIQFERRLYDEDIPFMKIGNGSIGGKARGLAFLNFLLSKNILTQQFQDVRFSVPNTVVISTDIFDFFMEQNGLHAYVREDHENEEIFARFAGSRLPEYIRRDLAAVVDKLHGPLAVRSSSLLEDSRSQPFAGVYKTYMLPNDDPDPMVRLGQIERAIKLVYASTFAQEARSYLKFASALPDEEKMAVIIQRLAGTPHDGGRRTYPDFSGVVQSYNYYPMPPLQAEDGVAYVALGLGKAIMDGYRSLYFSPRHPRNLHQLSTVQDFLHNSQVEFMAVDMSSAPTDFAYDSSPNIIRLGLDAAERDGTLAAVGSTYSPDNDTVYDGIYRPGRRMVTFAPILKNDVMPLAEILSFLSEVGVKALGSHVEIEFAVNLNRGGDKPPEFCLLQIRPMITHRRIQKVKIADTDPGRVLCESPLVLGNGRISDVRDLVYVRPEAFEPAATKLIAAQIEALNRRLRAEGRGCLLIGPGRWGSADPWLGIPVKWSHISTSQAIIETGLPSLPVDPSYGTHFFHNLASLGIGYFMVSAAKGQGRMDWAWLDTQPAQYETPYLRHIRLARPVEILIDGTAGRGVVLKPGT